MPGVVSVQPRVGGGLLDSVLKGVAIARDIYGIRHDSAATDQAEATTEAEQARTGMLKQQTEQGAETFADQQSGNYRPKEIIGLGKSYNFVPEGTPNALKIHQKGGGEGEEGKDVYILPKTAAGKGPVYQHVQNALIGGKHGAATYDSSLMDPADPSAGLVGFVETARAPGPDKAPKTREIKTVDDSGKPITKIVADEVGATYASPGGGRDELQLQKDWKELGKTMTSGNARNSTDMGRNQATITNANKILTLGKQGETQEGGLDKRQIHEAAIASANLVSSGSGTAQATIEALVPHTSGNLTANIEEWLTSDPKGVGQQAFVERMMETAAREKNLAGENIKTIKSDVLQEFSHLASADPERWQKTIDYNFGKGAKFDEFGHYIPGEYQAPAKPNAKSASGQAIAAPQGTAAPAAALHPEVDEAMAWAKANPKDPRAAEILRRVGATSAKAAPAAAVVDDGKVDRPSTTQGGL